MTLALPTPAILADTVVRLEPLSLDHVADLFSASGKDDELWQWMPAATPRTEDDMERIVRSLVDNPARVPYAVIHDGRAVGSTSFCDVPGFDLSVEIGWTWYGRAYWRTAVNTSCKVLLIDHVFGGHEHNRVLLKTDDRNVRSQRAIARIGGVHEATLRRHRPRPDGSWRDTVCFGILREEWPQHRARLTGR
ncbi:GNAT family N-acetyltransferase [Nonomuraea sp. NPDC050663]|uniref:GNAT family N-acetyltransferase n=1 Tax=Nonomuraea sp. NPDC050663 TaxID=3364370 RepID=UPI003788FB70